MIWANIFRHLSTHRLGGCERQSKLFWVIEGNVPNVDLFNFFEAFVVFFYNVCDQSNITDPGKQSIWIGASVTSTLPAVIAAPTVAAAVDASRSGSRALAFSN